MEIDDLLADHGGRFWYCYFYQVASRLCAGNKFQWIRASRREVCFQAEPLSHHGEAYGEMRNLTAADVMVLNTWAVDVESDVEVVAVLMMGSKSDRVPVREGARAVGIITRLDLTWNMMQDVA